VGRLRKVTDELSAEARQAMIAGFIAKKTAAEIAAEIAQATGETVAERTVSRRREEWQAEQDRRRAARERMEDLVAAMKAGDMPAADMILALAGAKLQEDPEALTGGNPLRLQEMALKAQVVAQKERQLDLRERAVAIVEKKLQLQEERMGRADAAAAELEEKAGRGETITADQVAKIREIYGLNRGSDGQHG
jgi:hypothetical protein